uniref:Putative zinc-finger domain-containing protein n=1 Tax=Magnetococcus massalia (strain MO-1) TaxID=451514 RepID=A0A1S7LH07_MAGMO|nr:conserved protein of unknown function [Candidatus Magnetococcus massalia]
MECNPELVSAFLDGELDDVIVEAFLDHLIECPECQILLASLGELEGFMAGGPILDSPEEMTQGIMMTIRNGEVSSLRDMQKKSAPRRAVATAAAQVAEGERKRT